MLRFRRTGLHTKIAETRNEPAHLSNSRRKPCKSINTMGILTKRRLSMPVIYQFSGWSAPAASVVLAGAHCHASIPWPPPPKVAFRPILERSPSSRRRHPEA